jgi:hypothetical protein
MIKFSKKSISNGFDEKACQAKDENKANSIKTGIGESSGWTFFHL